jgi:hypothetical protein
MTAIDLTPDITIQSLIDRAHEAKKEPPRPHIGCSVLGGPCDRRIWLEFRWASREEFEGRMLRLFRRGHREEETIRADLEAIGVVFSGDPLSVSLAPHVGGTADGLIDSGVPEAPKARHVLECKTHSLKSFAKLKKEGLRTAKPEHWAQCQLYMHGLRVKRALYVAVCKDNDEMHTERVHYDEAAAMALIERGARLALTERMPPPISTDPSWRECKYCHAHEFCHESHKVKPSAANCRTCSHVTPTNEGTWHCAKHKSDVPLEFQLLGCEAHVIHPDLVPWQLTDDGWDWTAVYKREDGATMAIGGDQGEMTSAEALARW